MFLFFYVVPSIPIYVVPQNKAIQYILPVFSPLLALTNCMISKQMIGKQNYIDLTTFPGLKLYTGG